jgi:hypothetical protein
VHDAYAALDVGGVLTGSLRQLVTYVVKVHDLRPLRRAGISAPRPSQRRRTGYADTSLVKVFSVKSSNFATTMLGIGFRNTRSSSLYLSPLWSGSEVLSTEDST